MSALIDDENLILCNFSGCKKLIENPVMLICCGESICEKHINFIFKDSNNRLIKCPYCMQEYCIPKTGLPLNNFLQRLVNKNLDSNYFKTKASLESLNKTINLILSIIKGNNSFLDGYFNNLKTDILEKQDKIENFIKSYYEEQLAKVEVCKKECLAIRSLDSSSKREVETLIDTYKDLAKDVKKETIDPSEWHKINLKLSKVLDTANSKLRDFQDEFLKNKSYKFASLISEEKLTDKMSDILGTLTIENILVKHHYLISCSHDRTIKIWDLETGQSKTNLNDHHGEINSIKLLTYDRLVSCSWDKSIKLWNLNTNKSIKTFDCKGIIACCLKEVQETEFLSGHINGDIHLWNIHEKEAVKSFIGHTHYICSMELISEEKKLISCCYYEQIRVWCMKTSTCLKILCCEKEKMFDMKLIQNANSVICCEKGKLKVWNLETSTFEIVYRSKDSSNIWAIELLEDNRIAIASETIHIWDLKKNSCIATLNGHKNHVLKLKAFSSEFLVSCSRDGTIKIWDINSYECLQTMTGHQNTITSLELITRF